MINILFVDDQHCRPKNRSIYLAKYGALQDLAEPFVFHYETAENDWGGYSVEPVLKKISTIPALKAVVCDMMFEKMERFGLEILKAIHCQYLILPVFMMTSVENKEVIEESVRLGATGYLIKMPRRAELEEKIVAATTNIGGNK